MKTPRTSKLPPFFTQAIGALPRPRVVADLLTRRQEFTPERWSQIMDDLVRFSIRMQGLTGLDVVSDGAWRHTHFVGDFLHRLGGFEQAPKVTAPSDNALPQVVVRRMSPTGSVFKADADFLVNNTARLTKFSIPSPFHISMAYWHEDYSKNAYPTRQHFVDHLVEILSSEVHALVTAGIDMIQLDDPLLAPCCEGRAGAGAEYERLPREWNLDQQFPQVIAAINRIADAASGKAEVHLHCWDKRGGAGDYRELLIRLKNVRIDRINLDFACRESVACLEVLPAHMGVGVGVLDVRAAVQQSVEAIQSLAMAAARVVPPARIALNPDRGFDISGLPTIDDAYDRLRRLTAAAKTLRTQVT
jgi:5-methyltetrahydropteroyltriglutamate--homocysteine methyltransferase